MESIVVALITGLMTLLGVMASNSKARAVLEERMDALTRQVEKHNCLVERTYKLEQDVAVMRHDVDGLKKEDGR